MFTLKDVRKEYDRLDKLCGVDTRCVELVESKKGVYRFGSCKATRDSKTKALKSVKIRISTLILQCGDEHTFFDIIRHEYAHAVAVLRDPANRHGHDSFWKAICREIGCAPERIHQGSTPEMRDAQERKAKYIATCTGCGNQYFSYRAGRFINVLKAGTPHSFSCNKCRCRDFSLVAREGDKLVEYPAKRLKTGGV